MLEERRYIRLDVLSRNDLEGISDAELQMVVSNIKLLGKIIAI